MNKRIKSIISALLVSAVVLTGCTSASGNNTIESAEQTESASTYGSLYEENTISEINIEIAEDDWSAMLADPTAEQYYSANITINGDTIENVGFRTKGFSSLTTVAQSDSERYGFKINFDKYVDGQTYNGLSKCVLNANFADPSSMREYLTYEALDYIGADTPDNEYTSLYINGELYGLYLCVESIDDSFVERVTDGGSTDTALYKADSENCTLTSVSDVSGFTLQYGSDDNNSNISNLISVLNSMEDGEKGDIESILDVDSVLKAAAVNTVMGNYDSYSGSKAHNYYLLYNNGKFEYIAWDFNMSMGGFTEDGGASVTVDISEPFYNTTSEERPLISNLLEVEEYYNRYLEYVNSLLDYTDNFESRVSEVASLIRESVANDPTAFYTIDKFESNIVASDTDLSTVTSGQPGGGNGMRGGNGGEMPQMPEGMDSPQMMTPPADGNKQMPENAGQMPENGGQMPQDGGAPELPEGMEASGEPGQKPDNMNGGGGMISNNAVSIIDYVLQRAANIRSQLS